MIAAALAIQQGLLWWLYYHAGAKTLIGDELHYLQTARAILAGGPWHPSHIWPPGQPLLIAGVMAVTGDSLWPFQLLQAGLFVACGWLLWRLWTRLGGNPLAAALAAALFVLNPSTAAYADYLWPEIPHLCALLLALNLLLVRVPASAAALAAGAAVGIALLFKSLLTGFWPLLLLCFVERWWRPRVAWKPAGAFLLGLAVVVSPALIAGHRNTGHWSIADSSTFNLLAGLNDRARNDYVDDPVGPLFERYLQSGASADERERWARLGLEQKLAGDALFDIVMRQMGRQYFRLFESKTPLLTQLPGPACAGYLGSYAATPDGAVAALRWTSHLFHIVTLAGFAFGLCLWRDWRKPWLWLLLAFVGYQLALYLGLHVKARYLLPMLPVFCGFAGEALAACAGPNPNLAATRVRLALATALSLLLLFLAFAGPWLDDYCRR